MINHILREYSKIEQKKYKTGYDWVGKSDSLRIV